MPQALKRGLLGLAVLVVSVLAPNGAVGAEDLPAYDQHVMTSLALLDTSSATDQLHQVLDSQRISVRFVQMTPGVYARYSVARHVIEVDQRWADIDDATLAAVIAHEATHAQDAVGGALASGGASACIGSEIRAFRTAALFWLDVHGRSGKAEPLNELEYQLNSIADLQLRDPASLEQLVRQTYSQQCNH